MPDAAFCLSGFNIFRKDRATRGGGTAKLVRSHFSCSRVDVDQLFEHLEIVSVDVSLTHYKLRLICCYLPPSCSASYLTDLLNCLASLLQNVRSVAVCGDFNQSHVNWVRFQASHRDSLEILRFVASEGLTQLVTEPTHISGNILDLVFATDRNLVSDVSVGEPLATSDHFSVSFRLACGIGFARPLTKDIYDFSRLQVAKNFLLGVNWFALFEGCSDVESLWRSFKDCLLFALENLVPRMRVKRGSARPFPLNADTIEMLSRKRKSWQRYKVKQTLNAKLCYLRCSAMTKNMIVRDRIRHEDRLSRGANSSAFFKYVKRSLGRPSEIPPLINEAGSEVLSEREKCV